MRTLITTILLLASPGAFPQDAKTVEKLGFGDGDEKVEAIAALVAVGSERSAAILQALADGELQTSGKRVLIVKGEAAADALIGEKLAALPADRDDITVNNRIRR